MRYIIVLLLAWAFLAHSLASAFGTSAVARPTSLISMHMLTARVGWAASQVDILHTVDGGRHWQTVTPAALRGSGFTIGSLPLDVIGGRVAWLAAPNAFGTTVPSAISLFYTHNGGKSWEQPPALRIGRFAYIPTFQFVDQKHGWLIVIRDVAMMQISFDIYRTTDHASHWSRILHVNPFGPERHPAPGSLPGCDCQQSYSFVAPESGWVGGCYCGLAGKSEFFFHSNNGGRSWRALSVALPRAYHGRGTLIGAPVFFTAQRGVLSVYILTASGHTYFDAFHTSDAGRTWHGTTPIRLQTSDDPGGFVDAAHGFLLDGRTLYRTVDGGRHWEAIPTILWRGSVSHLEFVSPRVGFTIEQRRSTGRSQLLGTTDGGRTWAPIE